MIRSTFVSHLLLGIGLSMVAGCGMAGPDIAAVEGEVTLDGEPLAGADIEFQPQVGRPSFAVTDNRGRYELLYTFDQPGALVGQHEIRITTQRTRIDEQGNTIAIVESVPARYNTSTTLKREIISGDNACNFDLKK